MQWPIAHAVPTPERWSPQRGLSPEVQDTPRQQWGSSAFFPAGKELQEAVLLLPGCQGAAVIDGDDGATAPAASGSPSVSDAGRQIPPFPGPAEMPFCEQSLLYIHLVAMALIVSM